MCKDLGEYLSRLSLMGNPLGLYANGQKSKRLLFWLVLIWFDLAQALVVAFLPTESSFEFVFIYTGDIGFQHFAYRRHFLTFLCLFIRLNTAIILSFFYFDNFDWFYEANRLFLSLITPSETSLFDSISKLVRIRMSFGFILQVVAKLTTMTYSAIYYRDRFENYYVSIQLGYFVYFALIHSMTVEYTLNTIYFYCRVASKMFDRLNQRLRWMAAFSHKNNWFKHQHIHFTQLSLLVYHFNHFIYFHYVVYFAIEMPNMSNMFYNTYLDHHFSLYLRIAFSSYLVYMLLNVVIMSHVIGQINQRARLVGDNVYKHFVVHGQMALLPAKQRQMVVNLSQHAMSEDIGLVVVGSPINSTTIIKILTIFLTLNSLFITSFNP